MTQLQQPPADVREMYMAHTMFRREFSAMPGLVRAVAAGDVGRAGVVADHIDLVKRVLHDHHHGEDVHLWPKLFERGPGEIAPMVDLMESQHRTIGRIIEDIDASIGAWRATADAAHGARLAEALDRMLPALGEHLGAEEDDVLPLVEKYVTADEWDAMVRAEIAEAPPEDGPLVFGMMMYEGEPAVLDKAFSQVPPEMRGPLREAAQQAFAANAELLHGTATPPRSAP